MASSTTIPTIAAVIADTWTRGPRSDDKCQNFSFFHFLTSLDVDHWGAKSVILSPEPFPYRDPYCNPIAFGKLKATALIISALLIVWAGFLLISFLVMGLGDNGRIDPVGWAVMAAFALVVGLGGPAVWRCFKRGPGASGRSILIAIGAAAILSIVGFSSGRDWLIIGIPMLLLACCLAAIRKLGKNKV